MGVEAVLILLGADQLGRRNGLGHGDDGFRLGQLEQELLELRLEVKAVPKDKIGLRGGDDVGPRLAIGVGVNPRPHQGGDIHQLAADLAGGVGDHAGGGDNGQAVLRSRGQRQRGGGGQGKQ